MPLLILILLVISPIISAKIVSLDPATTEIIYALSLEEDLIARDEASNYPEPAKKLPIISRHTHINLEALVKLKPKFIIAYNYTFKNLPRDYNTILLENKEPEDIYENLNRIRKAFPNAKQINIEKISLQEPLKNKKFILFIDEDSRIAIGKDSFISLALEKCGWQNAVKLGGYPKLSREHLTKLRPDFSFKLNSTKGLDPDLFSRLTPRFFTAVNQLCKSSI